MTDCLYNASKQNGNDCDSSNPESWIDRDTLVWLVEESLPSRIDYDTKRLQLARERLGSAAIEYVKGSTNSAIKHLERGIEKRRLSILRYRGIIALIDMGGI